MGLVSFRMGDRTRISISGDSLSDETFTRGALALLLWRQYETSSGIDVMQLSIFFFFSKHKLKIILVKTFYH